MGVRACNEIGGDILAEQIRRARVSGDEKREVEGYSVSLRPAGRRGKKRGRTGAAVRNGE